MSGGGAEPLGSPGPVPDTERLNINKTYNMKTIIIHKSWLKIHYHK